MGAERTYFIIKFSENKVIILLKSKIIINKFQNRGRREQNLRVEIVSTKKYSSL